MATNDSTRKYWNPVKKRQHSIKKQRAREMHLLEEFPAGEVIDKKKLAEIFGRTPKTIQNWVTTQNLPCIRVRYENHFVISDVLEWAYDKAFISKESYTRLKEYVENVRQMRVGVDDDFHK